MIDKGKLAALAAAWRKKNPEKSKEISRRSNAKRKEKNPELVKGYQDAYREKNRAVLSAKDRERKFGVDLAAYSAMVAAQDNKCAICRKPETATRGGKVKALAVDHDHKTGRVRGLLCSECNIGIGKFGDSRDEMISAIRYLDVHAKPATVVALKSGEKI